MGNEKNKLTIFQIFLIPMVLVMMAQSIISMSTLVFRRTSDMLQDYSVNMMSRIVENRKTILQNDMVQRWSSISSQEDKMNLMVEQFIRENNLTMEQVMESEEMRNELLERLFPDCVNIVENSMTTGVFMILTGEDYENEEEFEGFYVRDSNPSASTANYSDLMMERGNKQLSRKYNIALDTWWSTMFSMHGQGERAAENYFYETWRAARENPYASAKDLGYWSEPFVLGDESGDSHEMITYTVPLRYDGIIYAVLGVEVSVSYLYDYLPVSELSESEQAGYCLAIQREDGSYSPLMGRGVLFETMTDNLDRITMRETEYDDLYLVEKVGMGNQHIFAAKYPIKLYSTHAPYDNTNWVLLGLNGESELFEMSRTLYLWMFIALLVGLVFSLVCVYFLIHSLTRPIKSLMQCISRGRSGLKEYKMSNILEFDALYEVIDELNEKQKETEELLIEEKELYRMVMDTTKDTFFSYDIKERTVDIINNERIRGRWDCSKYEGGFIDLDLVHEEDRRQVKELTELFPDVWNIEFRFKGADDEAYQWLMLTGTVICDADGNRYKVIGSFHNIQKRKEREEQELRLVTMDGVTGFYGYSAGMEKLRELRRYNPNGTMVYFMMDNLRRLNEQNGITFGDMILEEFGNIVRKNVAHQNILVRFDGDEFCIWLQDCSEQKAEKFVKAIFEQMRGRYDREIFKILLHVGIVSDEKGVHTRELTRMAKQAQMAASESHEEMYYCIHGNMPQKRPLPSQTWRGKKLITVDYGENVNLVSLALALFGKGDNLAAQMYLLFHKIGQYYNASDVLLTIIHSDFHTLYLEYQWHRDIGADITDITTTYQDDKYQAFIRNIENKGILTWSKDEKPDPVFADFCRAAEGSDGYAVPLYDNGIVIGTLSILNGFMKKEDMNAVSKNMLELSSVIQSQINQQKHDLASRAKSDFLSRMSHEIRTPMNGIIGMTSIALQQNQSPDKILDCLQKIQTSSNYLLGLINDILDMSKIESGKMHLEPSDFSISEALETIEELIRPQAAGKNIDFIMDVNMSHNWFCADKLRISQVLINLLGNAVKFTQEGGKVFLTVREEEENDGCANVYFAVRDTGMGIRQEDQERVFRAFEQAKSSTDSKLKGTGLGLSISSRMIQMMGGVIELKSAPGEGSTFYFTISLPFGNKTENDNNEDEFSFEGYRILLVEDNELNEEIARTILEGYGFEVDHAGDGAQAVKRVEETAPGTYDLILMDIMMPVMDGLDATRAIRAMEREDCGKIPIIAMSANAFDDDLKKSVECGMNGHLSKPVEIDKLYKVLKDTLVKKFTES